MTKQLSRSWAVFYIIMIGVFHLVSGFWELLIGVATMESTSSGIYFLLDVYRDYSIMLSGVTFLIGIGLLLRLNFARILAIVLAWWNLFTAPIIDIWWSIYSISIKKFLVVTSSWSNLWLGTVAVILVISLVRIYIIRMLNISRAGYVFLKER